MTICRTAGKGRGRFFIPLCHFLSLSLSLTNIKTSSEMIASSVRAYLFLYPSTVKASPVCSIALDILGGTDQRSCVEDTIVDTSAKFLYLSFWIYHISPTNTKFWGIHKPEIKRYDKCVREEILYIDTGYNRLRATINEKILNIRRLP